MAFTEPIVEDAALTWFGEQGYAIGHGPQIVTLRDTLSPKLISGELRVMDGMPINAMKGMAYG